jgi:hypothetical protein
MKSYNITLQKHIASSKGNVFFFLLKSTWKHQKINYFEIFKMQCSLLCIYLLDPHRNNAGIINILLYFLYIINVFCYNHNIERNSVLKYSDLI